MFCASTTDKLVLTEAVQTCAEERIAFQAGADEVQLKISGYLGFDLLPPRRLGCLECGWIPGTFGSIQKLPFPPRSIMSVTCPPSFSCRLVHERNRTSLDFPPQSIVGGHRVGMELRQAILNLVVIKPWCGLMWFAYTVERSSMNPMSDIRFSIFA